MSMKNFRILSDEEQAAQAQRATQVKGVVDALYTLEGPQRLGTLQLLAAQLPNDMTLQQAQGLLGNLTGRELKEAIKVIGPKLAVDFPAADAAKLLKDLSGSDRVEALNAIYKR